MLITPEDLAAIVADVGLDALRDESIEEFENALHDRDLDRRPRDGFATGGAHQRHRLRPARQGLVRRATSAVRAGAATR